MFDDLSDNSELKIIQEHLNLQTGNILLFSKNTKLIDYFSSENLNVFSSTDQTISDKIDTLLSTNTFQTELSKYGQKFDTIIIHDIFKEIKHPELFLNNLNSILSDEGTIVCSISNFFHINNILCLFAGQLVPTSFDKTLRCYDLDSILFLLNKNNLHALKVNRIKQDLSPDQMNLDKTLIPSELIDIIHTLPDFDTVKYILIIGKDKTISSKNLEFVSQFPKNYLLPKLQEFFEKSSQLENSVSSKDEIISGLEASIKEQQEYTQSAISDKDEIISGLEASIKEQQEYTQSAISDKDEIISGLEASIKEQQEYTQSAISDKDEIISGLEASIKEQQEYIKNLEEHIRNLDLKIQKFKFWKK